MAEESKNITNSHRKTLDIVYIAMGAAILAVCSWISIPLTVPVTLQTMGVCIIASLFGWKRSTLSILAWIALAAIGVPVLSGFSGGIGTLLGPTGGYIFGFIFTGIIVGIVNDKKEGKLVFSIISMIIGILVCYVFGTAWFAFVYAKQGTPASLGTILGWCVIPFLLPDAVKIVLASIITNRLRRFVK